MSIQSDNSYVTVSMKEAFERYKQLLDKDEASQVTSTVLRFVLTGLGLVEPVKRISPTETIKRINLLENIQVNNNLDLISAVDKSFEILQPSDSQKRKTLFYLNKFVEWLDSEYLIPQTKIVSQETYENKFFRPQDINNRSNSYEKNIKPDAYALQLDIKHYKHLYADDLLVQNSIQKELDRIANDEKSFEDFQYNTLENKNQTVKSTLGGIKRMMGYLYKNNTPLEKISLTTIVPFIPIKIRPSDYGNDYGAYLIAKEEAQEKNTEAGHEIVSFIKKFLSEVNPSMRDSSKLDYCDSVSTLVKYLYQKETDKTKYDNYEDIPIILIIRKYRRELAKKAEIHYRDRRNNQVPITWEEVIQAMEYCRLDADTAYYTKIRNIKRSNGERYRRVDNTKEKRTLAASADAYYRFLTLACFVIIGPDRQEVYRNLRIDKSLKYGLFDSFNNFTPEQDLEDKSQAKFYIDPDYKTKKTYGRIIQEIPNHEFSDGRKFYDYWKKWLFVSFVKDGKEVSGLRNSFDFDLVEEDIVFPRTAGKNRGMIASQGSLYQRVRSIMNKLYGKQVSCHVLRNIYVSHEKVLEANYKERSSTAFLMKHSLKMQENVYRMQSSQEKLKPGQDLLKRVNEYAIEKSGNFLQETVLTTELVPVKNPNVPYGYSLFGTELKEDPNEQMAIALMGLLRKDGLTYEDIATKLNSENYTPRRGNKWTRERVRHFFRTNKALENI